MALVLFRKTSKTNYKLQKKKLRPPTSSGRRTDLVLPEDHAPPEAPVEGPLVEHDGVFDVVARVRHDGD